MRKKKQKSAVKPQWELLYETNKENVNRLIEVYKKSKLNARVLYNQDTQKYHYTRIVKFTHENGDFEINVFNINYGISTTSIIYHRQCKMQSIIYKNKKFWHLFRNNKTKVITQLTYAGLENFITTNFHIYNDVKSVENNPVYKFLLEKFGWLRNVGETGWFHHISLNTIMNKKLFGANDLYRHVFKCPLPIAKMITDINSNLKVGYRPRDFVSMWYGMKKSLINIENLKTEFYNSPYFADTCRMANSLGRKINCSWSLKRLKTEHDKWAEEINNIVMSLEPIVPLTIHDVFKRFEEFSGYRMLKTNHELVFEGRIMKHCVGSYVHNVNSGRCAIYHVEGHTLEIKRGGEYKWEIYIGQYRGLLNADAPKESNDRVIEMITKFHEMMKKEHDENKENQSVDCSQPEEETIDDLF